MPLELLLTTAMFLAAFVAGIGWIPDPDLEKDQSGTFAEASRVLVARCLECHGGAHRRSELSFADRDTFEAGGARGPVVDVEDPEGSRLLEVIEYENPELAMPQSGALPEAEVETLRAWILAGAPWPAGDAGTLADASRHPLDHARPEASGEWWAYGPLEPVEVPTPAEGAWCAHPVDAFVRAGTEAAGLGQAPEARPEVLLRRATFDLTGLPPTEDQRAHFLADVHEEGLDGAWDRLLDELFSSPHYGEAQARHWLDQVRYAETDGYERDSRKKNIWRYRDWVIRALGDGMGYDRFVKLQLAGDEYSRDLTDPYEIAEAQLATGFYRIGLFDDEPADRQQVVSDDRADVVDTVSQVVFGTTMGCARCHDHKADPITQKEYFSLTAHFAGVTRYAKDGTRDLADTPGPGVLTVPEFESQLAQLDEEIEAEFERLGAGAAVPIEAPETLIPDARTEAIQWRFLELDGRQGDGSDDWLAPSFDDSDWPLGTAGFGAHGTPASIVGTEWKDEAIRLRTTFSLEAIPAALRLTFHHDDDLRVWLNGQLVFERSGYVTSYRAAQLDTAAREALVVGRNVLCVDCVQDFGGRYVDVGLDTKWDPTAEGGRLEEIRRFLDENGDDPNGAQLESLVGRRARLVTQPIARPYPAHVVYERGPTPPRQFVELRGSVHAPGDKVDPALPAAWLVGQPTGATAYVLPPAPEGSPSSLRRRALADWAFEGGAHVTSRVAANRTWQFLFGRGLCPTPGDFGRLGEAPTHPELLDYLSLELIRRDWSVPSLQRWLMESRTYKMASEPPAGARDADPRNRLYSHFDPRRLTAEEYRDATLAASGELNRERFGPWVFPPLAQEVLATSSTPKTAWGQSSPEDALRRSLYVHVKRSLREPLLAALDQPDPDLPCPARFPTNVPTQALLTLNGDFVQGRARAMAQKLLSGPAAPKTPADRIRAAVLAALGREAKEAEVARALTFLGAAVEDHGLSEPAALALFTLGLFNRNEFLWID